jgi:hypothetical protein
MPTLGGPCWYEIGPFITESRNGILTFAQQLSQESCSVLMNSVYASGQQYPTFSRIELSKLNNALIDFYGRVRQAGLDRFVSEQRPTIARWFLYQRYWVRKGTTNAEDEAPAPDYPEEKPAGN